MEVHRKNITIFLRKWKKDSTVEVLRKSRSGRKRSGIGEGHMTIFPEGFASWTRTSLQKVATASEIKMTSAYRIFTPYLNINPQVLMFA